MILKGEFGFGSASAAAWVYRPQSEKTNSAPSDFSSNSAAKLAEVFDNLKKQLLQEKKALGDAGDYLDFPVAVLDDTELLSELHAQLNAGLSPADAVSNSFSIWEKKLLEVDDPYLKLRVNDLIDLRRQILSLLHGGDEVKIPNRPFIFVSKDIFVTELLRFRKFPLAGICLEEGNEAAHGVLLAKALGVPVVGKVAGIVHCCNAGDHVFFNKNIVYLNEATSEGQIFSKPEAQIKSVPRRGARLQRLPRLPKGAAVRANVQLPEEFGEAKAQGAMGVGLFRTELLWMSRRLSEAEETAIYQDAIQIFSPDPVIFRLADFGSDKPYEGVTWPKEANPALGWRGLRFLLDERKILHRQLDCMFQAAGKEKLHLLLPMVRSLHEVDEFLMIINPYKKKFPCKVNLGIMIETPSSAYLIEKLPKEISFVSLGTNDLLQYFFAVDRIHSTMKVNPMDPSFIAFLKEIIGRAKRKKLSLSICGELASNPKMLPVLFKLGIHEFSVSIPKLGSVLSGLSKF